MGKILHQLGCPKILKTAIKQNNCYKTEFSGAPVGAGFFPSTVSWAEMLFSKVSW